MKKIISILLMLALCLGLFAGCNPETTDPTEPAASDLSNAKTFLFKMYNTAGKDEENKFLADKDLTTVVVVGGVNYPVTWTVEITAGPADSVKITESDSANAVKLDIMEQPEEELHYTLTGTVTDEAGNTESMSLKCFTPAVKKVEISDDKIVIFNADSGMYVTGTDYLYTSSSGSQKHELVLTEDKSAALALTIRENGDGTVTFVTDDGKFLMSDGTNVQLVDAENDNTAFVLESAENGQFIKCAKATYNDNPQYLEIYSGYLTVYGMNEAKAAIYTFQFETAPNQAAILDAAYSLGTGETLVDGPYTLTGVISSIDTAFDSTYGNITVTIVCDGDTARPMMCYRLKGEGADKLAVGDTITVTGQIKNYNGTVEFDAGCTLDKVISANGNEPEATEPTATEPTATEPTATEPATKPATKPETKPAAGDAKLTAGTAYKFGMLQGNLNTVYYLAGGMDGYYMATTTDKNAALDVYVEETTGGYYFYTMVNGAKTYINMVISGTHVNGAYEAAASTVYTFKYGTLVAVVNDAEYWFATRNDKNYTTMGPCAVSYEGFYGQFYLGNEIVGCEGSSSESKPETKPETPDVSADYVTAPKTGVAYKWGLLNTAKGETYYLAGGMSGFYMATTTDKNAAVDVYLEATEGGYYLYMMDGSSKLYINMEVSGTHLNAVFGSAPNTVYVYNTEYHTLVGVRDGVECFFGTYSNYVTVGVSKFEKIGTSYATHFYG